MDKRILIKVRAIIREDSIKTFITCPVCGEVTYEVIHEMDISCKNCGAHIYYEITPLTTSEVQELIDKEVIRLIPRVPYE